MRFAPGDSVRKNPERFRTYGARLGEAGAFFVTPDPIHPYGIRYRDGEAFAFASEDCLVPAGQGGPS